ncbi:MAG: AAA family ATPase, partial [Thermoleophilaceae bacterium]
MRIERIEIDGFGRFHDAGWVLDEGLTVLVGANEAGKSTLLNALRALLFGFEPTRDGRAWYPALAGGRRGGRLALVTASGERWTVERHGEKGGGGTLAVRAPNGNQGGQETLSRLLHGADRDLFNNIFAFGLGELQSFSSLSADGVRGRIYGAGAGLGGTSAVELERRLRQQQDANFLVRGSQKPLNALLGQLESTRAEIAELSRQPAEHEAAHRERAELEERASALRVEIRAARERGIRLENLQRAGPIAAELAAIEGELAAGDASLDTLPTDAVTELDRRAAEASQARAVVGTIDERLEADRSERAALVVDAALLGAADEILALRDATAARAGLTERRRDHAAAEMRHQATVAEQLARTGIAGEGGLLALDDSIAAVEATRSLEQGLAGARSAAASAEESRRSAAAELAARQREVAGGEEASEERMEERAAALEGLDALRVRAAVAESRIASSGARLSLGATGLVGIGLVVAGLAGGFALGQLLLGQPLLGALVGAVFGALVTVVAPRAGGSGNELEAVEAERRELLARAGLPPDAGDERVRALATEIATARARAALAEDHRAGLAARQAELERRD